LKIRGVLREGPEGQHEITILARRLEWRRDQMTYQANERHAEKVRGAMGLKAESNGLERPAVKDMQPKGAEDGLAEELSGYKATECRAVAARAKYLAMDIPDIQFVVKEVCRDMAAPSQESRAKLMRAGGMLVVNGAAVKNRCST
jgi:hypothetical protein